MGDSRPARRELLSQRSTQIKIVALVAIPLILACVVVSVVQVGALLNTAKFSPAVRVEIGRMATQIALFVMLLMTPICILAAVWVSHRIVGPMRRLANDLKSVGSGRLHGDFVLRDGDDLTFMGESVTEMKAGLRQRVAALRAVQAGIEKSASRLESLAPAPSADLAAALRELQQSTGDLKRQLDDFQLSPPPKPAAK